MLSMSEPYESIRADDEQAHAESDKRLTKLNPDDITENISSSNLCV